MKLLEVLGGREVPLFPARKRGRIQYDTIEALAGALQLRKPFKDICRDELPSFIGQLIERPIIPRPLDGRLRKIKRCHLLGPAESSRDRKAPGIGKRIQNTPTS